MSGFRRALMAFRHTAGTYLQGRWIEGSRDEMTIYASVQPASGEDLKLLPEGRRSGAIYKLFTDSELLTADDREPRNPDIVMLEDGEYEVIHVAPWRNGVISHYAALVGRPTKRAAVIPPPQPGAIVAEGLVLE